MTQKRSYSRYFIILQEDDRGFALASDKLPSGYAKLEIKNDRCKITYYVQNLKKDKEPYYSILIGGKKDVKKIIKLNNLNIDDNGRAEVSYEYPVDNIANSDVAIDKIVGAGIAKFANRTLVSVMSGFSSTDIPDWKSYPLIENEAEKETVEEKAKEAVEAPRKEIEVQASETRQVKSSFDQYEEQIEASKVRGSDETQANKVITQGPGETEPQERSENKGKEENVDDNIADDTSSEIPPAGEAYLRDDADAEEDEEENIYSSREDTDVEDSSEEDDVDDAEDGLEDLNRHKKDNKKLCEDDCDYKKKYKVLKEKYSDLKAKYEDCKCKLEKVEHVEKQVEKAEEKCEEKKEIKELKDIKEVKEYKDKKDYPVGNVGEFFMNIVKGFGEIENQCNEIKRCRWFKVPVGRVEDLYDTSDYNKYNVVYYPMISYYPYIKKYGHYLLGYKCDPSGTMKYLVYGVPGMKSSSEQPFSGKSGFVTWIPMKEGDEREGSMGYWLMFYDYKTSTIIIPTK